VGNSLPRACAPSGLVGAKLRTPGANQKKFNVNVSVLVN
jgi:hypothetical protein